MLEVFKTHFIVVSLSNVGGQCKKSHTLVVLKCRSEHAFVLANEKLRKKLKHMSKTFQVYENAKIT